MIELLVLREFNRKFVFLPFTAPLKQVPVAFVLMTVSGQIPSTGQVVGAELGEILGEDPETSAKPLVLAIFDEVGMMLSALVDTKDGDGVDDGDGSMSNGEKEELVAGTSIDSMLLVEVVI